ncbi:MAG: metallophosphoesterase [Clostridia bacterium]
MKLKVLLVTDLHYVSDPSFENHCPTRDSKQSLALFKGVLERHRSDDIDLVLLLGDLVDDGNAACALGDARAIAEAVKDAGIACIVAAGNHDTFPAEILTLFDDFEGLHTIKGYQFINFNDTYLADNTCTRDTSKQKRFLGEVNPALPLIVLQHNLVYPEVNESYPYGFLNSNEILEAYEQAGVLLSISGHFHPGIAPKQFRGIHFVTCPALCERPYQYAILTFDESRQIHLNLHTICI